MKNHISIYLSILFLGFVAISSCQDAGQDDLLAQELLELNKKKELRELVDFINKHEIRMLAPYMVGYFDPESISELTVSWWTEEMEIEGLTIDPDWKGETPGVKLKLSDDGNFLIFGNDNDRIHSELVYTLVFKAL